MFSPEFKTGKVKSKWVRAKAGRKKKTTIICESYLFLYPIALWWLSYLCGCLWRLILIAGLTRLTQKESQWKTVYSRLSCLHCVDLWAAPFPGLGDPTCTREEKASWAPVSKCPRTRSFPSALGFGRALTSGVQLLPLGCPCSGGIWPGIVSPKHPPSWMLLFVRMLPHRQRVSPEHFLHGDSMLVCLDWGHR